MLQCAGAVSPSHALAPAPRTNTCISAVNWVALIIPPLCSHKEPPWQTPGSRPRTLLTIPLAFQNCTVATGGGEG